MKDDQKKRKTTENTKSRGSYTKRKNTLKKKAKELSTLCGIKVCVLCDDTEENHVDTWPENHADVSRILLAYYQHREVRKGREHMVQEIYEANIGPYPDWDPCLDYVSDNCVENVMTYVDDTVEKIEEKEAECSYQGDEEDDFDQEDDEDEDDDDEEEVDTEEAKDDEIGSDEKEDGEVGNALNNDLEETHCVPRNSNTSINNTSPENFNGMDGFYGALISSSKRKRTE